MMNPKSDYSLRRRAVALWRGTITGRVNKANARRWIAAVCWMDEHGMRALSGGNGCPVSTQERRGAA